MARLDRCELFKGAWGQTGVCTRMEESGRVPDVTCTPKEQEEYRLFAPVSRKATGGEYRAAEDGGVFQASRCVYVSSRAAEKRGAVLIPLETRNPLDLSLLRGLK